MSAKAARRGALRAFPLFLVGFLALAAVRSARLVDPETIADVDLVTRACFVIALAALGMQTRLGQLRELGARPLLLGMATAALLAAGSLAAILALGLRPARTGVAGGSDPRPLGAWTTVCSGAPPASRAPVAAPRQPAARMGTPRGCDGSTGDRGHVQRTTRGVARCGKPAT